MLGMKNVSVFDPEVYKPGSGLWLVSKEEAVLCLVRKCTYTQLEVSYLNIESNKTISGCIYLDEIGDNCMVVPIPEYKVATV